MLESQNGKASYHPMSIHFFFINSTPICGGGGGLPDFFKLVMPMQYCPWDATQAMRSHERSLGGRPGKRLGSISVPFELHLSPSFLLER